LKCQIEGHSKRFFSFEWIPPHVNTNTGLPTKGHNSYPWEFKQTVGRPDHHQQQICCRVIPVIQHTVYKIYILSKLHVLLVSMFRQWFWNFPINAKYAFFPCWAKCFRVTYKLPVKIKQQTYKIELIYSISIVSMIVLLFYVWSRAWLATMSINPSVAG
jgi:hypothetical protein